jgi:hypothetical protein
LFSKLRDPDATWIIITSIVKPNPAMLAYIRFQGIAALCLALAAMPAHALEKRAMKPAPLQVILKTECGKTRNETLNTFANRPLAWCPFNGTQILAGTTDTAALAGRRLYLTIDFDTTTQPVVPIALTMTSFSATGQVRTHLGMFFQVARGRLETSIYVPDDAASVYWGLTGGGAQRETPGLIIRDAQTRISETTFHPGQMCVPCSQYLDQAMERVRREFLSADRLKLEELDSALRLAATGAQDMREMDGPMKELSRKLTEAELAAGMMPHGRYQTKAEYALAANPVPAAQTRQSKREADPPLFDTKLLDKRVGYIRLGSFLELNFAAGQRYARALRDAMVSLHQQGARQWILDLRDHGGGTLFPAIAALRPLLGQGAVGYFVDASGKQHGAWLWGDPGLPIEMAGPYVTNQDPTFDGEREATAILLGPVTASSGEMLAIAFHGRPNTRSFGTPTAGYTTAVSGSPDRYGNFFGITSKYAADRNGQRIFPKVVPDVVVDNTQVGPGLPDPAISAARGWLGAQQ